MTVEDNLNERIRELEEALRDCRNAAEYNLYSPGNEDDTLNSISDTVTGVLHDNYVFDEEAYGYGDY